MTSSIDTNKRILGDVSFSAFKKLPPRKQEKVLRVAGYVEGKTGRTTGSHKPLVSEGRTVSSPARGFKTKTLSKIYKQARDAMPIASAGAGASMTRSASAPNFSRETNSPMPRSSTPKKDGVPRIETGRKTPITGSIVEEDPEVHSDIEEEDFNVGVQPTPSSSPSVEPPSAESASQSPSPPVTDLPLSSAASSPTQEPAKKPSAAMSPNEKAARKKKRKKAKKAEQRAAAASPAPLLFSSPSPQSSAAASPTPFTFSTEQVSSFTEPKDAKESEYVGDMPGNNHARGVSLIYLTLFKKIEKQKADLAVTKLALALMKEPSREDPLYIDLRKKEITIQLTIASLQKALDAVKPIAVDAVVEQLMHLAKGRN